MTKQDNYVQQLCQYQIQKFFLVELWLPYTALSVSIVRQVNQPDAYVCPLCFGFPSHLGHHRSPSSLRGTGGAHQLFILYTVCTYVNTNLPTHPPAMFNFRDSYKSRMIHILIEKHSNSIRKNRQRKKEKSQQINEQL